MKPKFPDLSGIYRRFDDILETGIFSNFGPQTSELAERFADFLGTTASSIVPVSNATAGITASVLALGGERWTAPSWTFSATAAGILSAGAQLRFSDIDRESQWLTIPPEGASDGVVAVAPFGSGFDRAQTNYPGRMVIDAAASIGATMMPLRELSETQTVIFSLHATKVLGIGEGGLVVCGSEAVADEIRSRVNFGFSDNRESISPGFNGKMSEFSAAIGHTILDGWDTEKNEWIEARCKVNQLSNSLGLKTKFSHDDAVTPYWIVEFDSKSQRKSVEGSLAASHIQTRQWWRSGCHNMPAYSGIPRTELVHTDSVAARNLGLPFFRGINDAQLKRIEIAIEAGLNADRAPH